MDGSPALRDAVKFSVCIPATRPWTLPAAIRSIQAQTVADWELLIVGQGDDGEVRQLVEAARRSDGRIRYLHIDRRGSSRARSAALRAASGAIIAMTDDDCEARSDWLAVIAGAMADEPEVALVGGALIAPVGGPVRPARCPELMPTDVTYDPVADQGHPPAGWNWIGANFALRREVAEQLGDFDEHLGVGAEFPCAGDSDYKLRMEARGLKMRTTPNAVVYHTYGWRYGLAAVLELQRRYARGMGGLAAKLTLLGDQRGKRWLDTMRRERLLEWLRRREPHRLPVDLRIRWHFSDAYRTCLNNYRVDAHGLLVKCVH
jgi:glycosyltransferase involved in cell wall biosynthesis